MTKRSNLIIPAKFLLLGAAILGPLLSMVHAQETPPPAPVEATAPAETTAAEAPVAPPTPEALEKRIADVEQYFNNMAPAADGKLANLSGPGHNGFLMVCAALVLFMTLPGLALFYGGLVRSKNVLSVLAQCLGIAGLVTRLW